MSLAFAPRENLAHAFATPVLSFELPDAEAMNRGLDEAVREQRIASAGRGLTDSNSGGWHSPRDLFLVSHPAVVRLAALVTASVRYAVTALLETDRFTTEVTLEAWANVSPPGAFNRMHNHLPAHWSGVYYVDDGGADTADPEHPGFLELFDPRFGIERAHPGPHPLGRTILVAPRPGLLVVFPSWLYHTVNPHRGSRDRVSIAWNATLANLSVEPVATRPS